MVSNERDGESGDDQALDENDYESSDSMVLDDSHDSSEQTALRYDVIDRVFATLSADAQRGEGELRRDDIDRAYLRKQLSIAECIAVEERIISCGYRIIDTEEVDEEIEQSNNTPRKKQYLTEAEEKILGRQIQLALLLPKDTSGLNPAYVDRIRKDADRARTIFVSTNIRFVNQLARKIGPHNHLSLEDISQEGFIGLLRAADLYDPERGFRFKTYAAWWIQQRMRRAIADGERTIRLPVHVSEKIAQVRRAKSKLTIARGIPPSIEELASALGMETEKLMKLLWYAHSTECSEGDMPIGEDFNLLSMIADDALTGFDLLLQKELKVGIRTLLDTLSPREAHILKMRFGIDLEDDYTLESIGQQYGLTRERIRQIEAKAMKKLRNPVRSDQLRDFLDF